MGGLRRENMCFSHQCGILEEKRRDFRFNGGFAKRKCEIFGLNGKFANRKRDFRINGGFAKRKCMIFASMGDSRREKS